MHSCYMTSLGSQSRMYKFLCSLEQCMAEMEVCMVGGLMLSRILLRGATAMMGPTLMKRLWWRSWQRFEQKPTTPRMRSGVFIVAYWGQVDGGPQARPSRCCIWVGTCWPGERVVPDI